MEYKTNNDYDLYSINCFQFPKKKICEFSISNCTNNNWTTIHYIHCFRSCHSSYIHSRHSRHGRHGRNSLKLKKYSLLDFQIIMVMMFAIHTWVRGVWISWNRIVHVWKIVYFNFLFNIVEYKNTETHFTYTYVLYKRHTWWTMNIDNLWIHKFPFSKAYFTNVMNFSTFINDNSFFFSF